ncbi:MAG: hypothetical protein AB1425_02715 [Actinomycetota bacterium]
MGALAGLAASETEVHHRVPRCLLRLHERASAGGEITGEGIEAWLEFEAEATRYGVPVDVSREDLAELIEASAVVIPAEEHREAHGRAGDFARWGRAGGLETLRRYGPEWMRLLGRWRWRTARAEELTEYMGRARRGGPREPRR